MPSRRFSRMTLLAVFLCVGAGSLTAGCGQKGPLYLPEGEGEELEEQETPESIKSGSPSGNT